MLLELAIAPHASEHLLKDCLLMHRLGLVKRVLGEDLLPYLKFELTNPASNGHDRFEVDNANDGTSIVVRGNSGVALASGLYSYLSTMGNVSITWGVNGTGDFVQVDLPLPQLPQPIRKTRNVRFSYAWNVCTFSYSAAWWNFTRWEREIDWMALHGVNTPLAFVGQEHVWYQLYKSVNLTDSEIRQYFTGPAFLAWQRMGNIRKWAGPLDDYWIERQHQLQLKILERMRAFGMQVVLPGFAGHVPEALGRVYPHAKMTRSALWTNFNSTYSGDYLLEPTDPLFHKLGVQYYKLLVKSYDMYNEMVPSSTDSTFLAAANRAVYDAMNAVDPQATYVMQAWLFHDPFWTADRVEAYLSDVPNDWMLILDLNSEQTPLWQQYDSYFKKPWVWNLLHNYGGRRGIYGTLDGIAFNPFEALKDPNATMVGIGFAPEAIETNPVVYELLTELSWHEEPVDTKQWLHSYVRRRYGSQGPTILRAWDMLHWYAYCCDIDISILEAAPSPYLISTHKTNATGMVDVVRAFVDAAQAGEVDPSSGPFRYDLTDMTRQLLSNFFADTLSLAEAAFLRWQLTGSNTNESIVRASALLQDILVDLNDTLGANENYLLGVWLEDALKTAPAGVEELRANRLFNAKNQITMWGPNGEINDYAAKHWSGLVADYYAPRFLILVNEMLLSVGTNSSFDWSRLESRLLQLGRSWGSSSAVYPSTPTKSPTVLDMAKRVTRKYATAPSSPSYTAIQGSDATGTVDILKAWSKDLEQLKILCNTEPTCTGFNSDGVLKNDVSHVVSSEGMTLYVKQV